MAEEKQVILIDVQLDTGKLAQEVGDATRQMELLKVQEKALNDEFAKGTITSEEYGTAIADVKKQIEQNNRAVKSKTALLQAATIEEVHSTESLESQRQALNSLQKAYAALSGDEKIAADQVGGLRDKIKQLSDSLKEQEGAIGDNRRNVGNYAEGFAKAFNQIGAKTKEATDLMLQSGAVTKEQAGNLQSVSHIADAFSKNPILGFLQILWEVISGNKEAMAKLQEILSKVMATFAKLEPFISKVSDVLMKGLLVAIKAVVSGIKWVLEGVDKIAAKFGKNLNLAGSFTTFTEEIVAASNATNQLAEDSDKLKKKLEEQKKAAAELYWQELELKQITNEVLGLTKDEEDAYYKLSVAAIKAAKSLKEYNDHMQAEEDAENEKDLQNTMKLLEKKKQMQEAYGLVQQSARDLELQQLEELNNAKLLKVEEYEQLKAEIEQKYQSESLENAANAIDFWGSNVLNTFSAISQAASASENAQLQEYTKANNKKKSELQSRLDSGLISQAEYDKQVAKLDEELAAQENEIAVKQAKREKALGIMSAVINTATAIMRIWADVPKVDFGVSTAILTALAAATGAAQIAAIAAEPLPTYATGGIVSGRYDAQDSVRASLSGGEMVLNPAQQKTLFDMANTGQSAGINYELLGQTMAAAVAAQPAPVMDYTEFKQFGQKVSTYNEIVKV